MPPADLAPAPTTDYRLSAHDRELLVLLSDGRTYSAAGAALGITRSTVKNEASAIFHRLGTGGLVETFHRLGWLVPR